MKLSEEEIKSMYQTCQKHLNCTFCPFNPDCGELGTCPNKDSKLVYAMTQGYRKESEVISETVSEIVKLIEDIFNQTHLQPIFRYRTSTEKRIIGEIFEAIDEKYKEVGCSELWNIQPDQK